MNVRTSKAIYLSLIIIFLGAIFSYVYYELGGFDEVKVYRIDPVVRTVFGKEFNDFRSDEYYDHGVRCREMVENGDINGTFAQVFYLNDTTEFIGIAIETDMAEVPIDFETREFKSGDRYAVFLSMHPLVQPRPRSIEKMIMKKAVADGNELRDYYFTMIYADNSRSVEWWVAD